MARGLGLESVLAEYASHFPDIRFSWQAVGFDRFRYHAVSGFNYDDAAFDEYMPIAHLNVIPGMAAQLPIDGVIKSEHFLPPTLYEQTDIFDLFFRKRDRLNVSRGLWAYRQGGDAAYLGIDIPARYSQDERDELDTSLAVILPHLQRSFALMLDLDIRRSRQEQAKLWLDTIGSAAFILSSDCRVSRFNDKAARLCRLDRGFCLNRKGDLVFTAQQTRKAVEARLRRAAIALEPEGPFAIPGPDGAGLSGYALPLPVGSQYDAVMSFFGSAKREVLLVVLDAGDLPPMPPETVSVALGLTMAEAQVVVRLCIGDDLREAADHLGISYNTARNQIARACERLGVRRQTALVSSSMGVLTRLGGLPGRGGNGET